MCIEIINFIENHNTVHVIYFFFHIRETDGGGERNTRKNEIAYIL